MAPAVDATALRRLARNAKPLLEAQGIRMGLEQRLDFVARLHGYNDFDQAREISRPGGGADAEKAGEPPWLKLPPARPKADAARRKRLEASAQVLGPARGDAFIDKICDLCSLIIAVLAHEFPGAQTPAARKAITEKYPDATEALIMERSMNMAGVQHAVHLFQHALNIVLCYTPDGTWVPYIKADGRKHDLSLDRLHRAVRQAMDEAADDGLSHFGAFAATVQCAVHAAQSAGVDQVALLKALEDCLGAVLPADPLWDDETAQDLAIRALAAHLGVTERTAALYAELQPPP